MSDSRNICDVAIAGGGPAGSSAAIHLANQGAQVLLVEEKRFPRPKLCGEFISPECLNHFESLGVADQMLSAGGASLSQTVFFSRNGKSVIVPSGWFGDNLNALGLSRAEMDSKLLDRAKSLGVTVLEGAHASDLVINQGRVEGIRLKSDSQLVDYHALITIDATGRTRALARKLSGSRKSTETRTRPKLIAFKAHLQNVQSGEGDCEIYSYPGGYGGLSGIEGGMSNFCFIASAKDVRRFGSDPDAVIREVVCQNARAAHTLASAQRCSEWLSVSLEGFGRHKLVPAEGLLAVGDAAAFIDPFVGSGMLMALESAELAAQAIMENFEKLKRTSSFASLARDYRSRFDKRFNSRLRLCSFLRRAAFVPWLAEAAIFLFASNTPLRHRVACGTRPAHEHNASRPSYRLTAG